MNRITIEYQAEGGRNLSRQLMAAVFEVLEQNQAECVSFIHREQQEWGVSLPGFMETGR